MPITLAGVNLSPITDAVRDQIARVIPLDSASPWTARAWPGPRKLGLTFPTGFRPQPAAIKPNTLVWPRGASRFAYGWFVASGDQAVQIRNAAFGSDGSTTRAVTLAMSAGGLTSNEQALNTNVWTFAPIPLWRVATDPSFFSFDFFNGTYLIPVVDDRWWWRWIQATGLDIDGTTRTWASAWTQLQAALGQKIFNDAVPASYRLPDASLELNGEPINIVMDAFAYNCGQRIIRRLDGKISSINSATGLQNRNSDDQAFPLRALLSGGNCFQDSL